MKKLIIALLVFLLFFSFISGCVEKPKDDCEKGGDAPPLPDSDGTSRQSQKKTGSDKNTK